MIRDMVILSMEWIGTVAFAISGALVAIGCSLDLFGVVTVGCITAVGGGVIRDILIGNFPPKIFSDPIILLVACITSLLVFLIAYFNRKHFHSFRKKAETANVFFDALGLASFSVTGVEISCYFNGENVLLAVTLGAITGVGGGVIRDILVNEKPYILTKHVYAVASIGESLLYYTVGIFLGRQVLATVLALIFTVSIRLLAAKFHWKLPKIKLEDPKK